MTEPRRKMSQRERADWPKTTWEMLSCWAKRMSASATFCRPAKPPARQIASHALPLFEAVKGLRVAVALVVVGAGDVDGVPVAGQAAGDA